jgi:hypothetical protein
MYLTHIDADGNATALRRAAWILATGQTLRNGPEALAMAVQALLLANEDAIASARGAIVADPSQAQAIQRRIERYQAGKPWRE